MTARYPTGEQLLDEAVAATGLDDFGPGDFREGLEVLLASIEHDADLHPDADDAVLAVLRRRLQYRLLVEDWYRGHPEIAELPVRGPVDVNGLPRTGTTALANMLSLDVRFRPLRAWEQAEPVPPPVLDTELEDPRRLAALAADEQVPPELRAMHLYDTDATVEDSEVLGMAFHGQQMTLPVWGYHAWYRAADLTETMRYHRRIITLLQSQRPPNLWLFKAPHHTFHLEALLAAYPDARFVMTHRDPAKAVPSYASLVSAILPPAASGERDPHRIGREICDHLREGMEHALAARARIGEDRFLDVHHRDLVADPIGTVAGVYEWLGTAFTPQVERAVAAWQVANRSGAHGAHRYTAEQFGLRAEQVRDDYDFYIRRFDVEVEG